MNDNLEWKMLNYEDFEYISELACIGAMGVLIAYHIVILLQFNILITICANVFVIALYSWFKRVRKKYGEEIRCQKQIKVEQ